MLWSSWLDSKVVPILIVKKNEIFNIILAFHVLENSNFKAVMTKNWFFVKMKPKNKKIYNIKNVHKKVHLEKVAQLGY